MSVLFDRAVDQSRIEAIVVVASDPDLDFDEDKAADYYGRMNHSWSTDHEVHVIKTPKKIADMDDCVTAAIAACVAFKPVPADHTLIVQPVKGSKANFCFCTYLAEKNAKADDSLIAVWEGPIPYKK